MEKHLRNAPTYAVIVALIIQVTRVSDFGLRIGAGWLAWVYAIFLALTIYVLAYWVGRLKYDVTASPEDKRSYAQQVRIAKLYKRARWNAGFWLFIFLAIDGSLNFAETMTSLPKDITLWEYGGAAVYGAFPTLAAFGLGSLQAVLDRIPTSTGKASFLSKLFEKLLARLDNSRNFPETYRKLTDDERKLTGNFPTDWRRVRKVLTAEQVSEIATLSSGAIAYKYGVLERTARNWRKYAQSEVAVEPSPEPSRLDL